MALEKILNPSNLKKTVTGLVTAITLLTTLGCANISGSRIPFVSQNTTGCTARYSHNKDGSLVLYCGQITYDLGGTPYKIDKDGNKITKAFNTEHKGKTYTCITEQKKTDKHPRTAVCTTPGDYMFISINPETGGIESAQTDPEIPQ